MAHRSSTTNSGNSGTPSVAVPSGAATNDIASLKVNFDRGTGTITWPDGFDLITPTVLRCTAEGQTTAIAFKRLSAGDTGTYDLSFTGGATDWVCNASLFSGRHLTNPPEVTTATQNTLQSSPVTINGATITALDGDDIEWTSGLDVSGAGIVTGPGNQTVPSSPFAFTERVDTENLWANLATGTADNVVAGATGTLVGSVVLNSGSCGYNEITVRYPQAAQAPVVNTNTLTSTLDTSDGTIVTAVRQVLLQDAIALVDELIKSIIASGSGTIFNTVLSDALTLTDSMLFSAIRARIMQDTILITEGSIDYSITTNMLGTDEIAIDDAKFVRQFFNRLFTDELGLTDEAITSFLGGNVMVKVLTSNITTMDEALLWISVLRIITDALDITDQAQTALQRFILLTDAFSVDDGAIATYVPDGGVPPVASDTPTIRVGFDQPRIVIGGYAL